MSAKTQFPAVIKPTNQVIQDGVTDAVGDNTSSFLPGDAPMASSDPLLHGCHQFFVLKREARQPESGAAETRIINEATIPVVECVENAVTDCKMKVTCDGVVFQLGRKRGVVAAKVERKHSPTTELPESAKHGGKASTVKVEPLAWKISKGTDRLAIVAQCPKVSDNDGGKWVGMIVMPKPNENGIPERATIGPNHPRNAIGRCDFSVQSPRAVNNRAAAAFCFRAPVHSNRQDTLFNSFETRSRKVGIRDDNIGIKQFKRPTPSFRNVVRDDRKDAMKSAAPLRCRESNDAVNVLGRSFSCINKIGHSLGA